MEINKQYKQVSFDVELAKKIQLGEIEGKIKTKCGNEVRILCFDLIDPIDVSFPIVCAVYNDKYVRVVRFTEYGRYSGNTSSELDLVLEVPDNEPQFKPFDKVLVKRNGGYSTLGTWTPAFFQKYVTNYDGKIQYLASGLEWHECIPYGGNEHLVGTTNNPE